MYLRVCVCVCACVSYWLTVDLSPVAGRKNKFITLTLCSVAGRRKLSDCVIRMYTNGRNSDDIMGYMHHRCRLV